VVCCKRPMADARRARGAQYCPKVCGVKRTVRAD
jgi:hypothetical protein